MVLVQNLDLWQETGGTNYIKGDCDERFLQRTDRKSGYGKDSC